MFSKKNRLANRNDISLVYGHGRSFFSTYFTIKFLDKPLHSRFALVISTKVSKRAVVRNRIRRQLREVLKSNIEALSAGDYVITVKSAAVPLESKILREELLRFLIKVKLLKD